jgi:thiamine-phosphate pyrophosphorylase
MGLGDGDQLHAAWIALRKLLRMRDTFANFGKTGGRGLGRSHADPIGRRMLRRQPLPRIWLMTDERADAALDRALLRLPRGGGIVFRHHATAPADRRARFDRVRRVALRRGLMLVLADKPARARQWRADGVHGRESSGAAGLLRTGAVHDLRQLRRSGGADLIFLSPVFPTRSHPGAHALGRLRFAALARLARVPAIALGGVDARKGRQLRALGAWGWAGIDAWS